MSENEIVFSVHKLPEGGYSACSLGYFIFTQADTMNVLNVNIRDAVCAHFGDDKAPPVIRLIEGPKGRFSGSAKGEVTVPEDFNDPLPKEIEDLFW